MEENVYPTPPCPASGGVIRLQARLTDVSAWMGPAWAALCGVLASGNFDWRSQDWLRLALLILLVDGVWGTLWAALGGTNWATPMRRWRNWRFGQALTPLPYTLPSSPGDQTARWLGHLRTWWRDIFWPTCGPAFSAAIVAIPMLAVLGALLGIESALLSMAALAVMQLGLAWDGGRGSISPGWDALIAVTLPWLAGHAAFAPLTLHSFGLALALALAWGAAWRADLAGERIVGIGAQILSAVLLATLYRPLAAGTVLLLMIPQLAMFPWFSERQVAARYARYARPWLMAAMLIAAWAL